MKDMKKLQERPNSALYPNPVMLVSAKHNEKESIITLSWGGTSSSDPPYVSIAIRKARFSYNLIKNSKEFVINIPTSEMLTQVEFCGPNLVETSISGKNAISPKVIVLKL